MDLAEEYGGPFETVSSIYYHVDEGRKKNPDGTALGRIQTNAILVAMHQASTHLSDLSGLTKEDTQTECLIWSHNQLHLAALKVAIGLKNHGVQPDSTVALLVPNTVEWAVLVVASTILPFTLVPLDPGALAPTRSAELERYIQVLRPSAIIVPSSHDIHAADAAMQTVGVQAPLRLFLDSDPAQDVVPAWKHFADIYPPETPGREETASYIEAAKQPRPERLVNILFTSGTSSGNPKGCPRYARSFCSSLQAQAPRYRMDTTSRFFHGTASFRAIGNSLSLITWSEGAAVVIAGDSFSPPKCLEAIERHRITHLLLVPAMLHALAADPSYQSRCVDSVKEVRLGADMITEHMLALTQKTFPSSNPAPAHGMTEGASVFKWCFDNAPLSTVPFYGGISPLGTMERGTRVRIYDLENRRIAKRDETGELHISSPSLIKHYLDNVNADAFYTDDKGDWFKTGDSAMMNKDGLVYILGRYSDRFKRAGIPVVPAALESAIAGLTGSQTSVFGVPHATMGAEPFAVVESFGGKSAEGIKQHILDSFGSAFALGGVVTLQQLGLEQFPKNSTGKIMKSTLREQVVKYVKDNAES